ncbi:MAG: glycosyltransferase family 2 protein [Candidatus Hydrothermia bacterium]
MLNFFIVVPVFNEAPRIPELVKRLKEYGFFEKTIFVDDGSTDGTAEIIRNSGGLCLKNVSNFGKGYSQRRGFEEALKKEADFIVTMDGDLQHDPRWIPLLISELLKGFDIVIGSRWKELHKMPKDRYLSNRLTTLAISLLVKKRLEDTQSGFRVYRRWVLEKVNFISNKFEAESELLIKAVFKGAKVSFVKIPALYSATLNSKIKRGKDTLRFMKMYFKIALSRS